MCPAASLAGEEAQTKARDEFKKKKKEAKQNRKPGVQQSVERTNTASGAKSDRETGMCNHGSHLGGNQTLICGSAPAM